MAGRLAAAALGLALLLPACGVVRTTSGAGAPPSAVDQMAAEIEREGWRDVQWLQRQDDGQESYVFVAYRTDLEFEPGQVAPAECWSFQFSRRTAQGGTGGGGGGCAMAAVPLDESEFGWSHDAPTRIQGTVRSDAIAADVVFKDGSTQRIEVFSAGPSWKRAFVSATLVQDVDQVTELRPVLAEG